MMTTTSLDEPFIPLEIFSGIIAELMIPNDDNDDLETSLRAISILNPSEGDRVGAQITNMVWETENVLATENPFIDPFICIFLAHCYNLYADRKNAEKYILEAIKRFTARLNKYDIELNNYNRALSHWYFGLLHCSNHGNDYSEDCDRHLVKASVLFVELQEKYRRNGLYKDYERTKKLYEHLQILQEKFRPQKTFPPVPAENREHPIANLPFGKSIVKKLSDVINATVSPENPKPHQSDRRIESSNPLTQRGLIVSMVNLPSNSQQTGASSNQKSQTTEAVTHQSDQKSSRHHITIPVDIDALLHPNSDTTPLPWNFYQELHKYEAHIPKEMLPNTNVSEETETTTDALSYVIPVIPGRIPVYGQVSAGPSGAPFWGIRAQSDPVDDALTICFEGIKYKVYFINGSPIKFSESKRYGWLKVEGDSMNRAITAIRKSIEDKDHVLFCENYDMEYCAGKIVVAEIQGDVDPTPRLVVKRLVKLSGAVPDRSDGFEPEIVKYILRSESSLDNDPKTGKSYKKDINIVRDDQIRGYVVAIAKPTA